MWKERGQQYNYILISNIYVHIELDIFIYKGLEKKLQNGVLWSRNEGNSYGLWDR